MSNGTRPYGRAYGHGTGSGRASVLRMFSRFVCVLRSSVEFSRRFASSRAIRRRKCSSIVGLMLYTNSHCVWRL
jgi:hypothetical protein